jgi:phage shock protein C
METKRLYRARKERMIFGICGGLGKYFGIDPTLVRLAFIILMLFPGFIPFWVYIIMALIIPEEPQAPSEAVVDATAAPAESAPSESTGETQS